MFLVLFTLNDSMLLLLSNDSISLLLHFKCNIMFGVISSILLLTLLFSIIFPPFGFRPLFLGPVGTTVLFSPFVSNNSFFSALDFRPLFFYNFIIRHIYIILIT